MDDLEVPNPDAYPMRVKSFEAGNCWFFGFYRDSPCRGVREPDELYCSRHLGVSCKKCDEQATHEEGEAGSVMYCYPFCDNHHYRRFFQ